MKRQCKWIVASLVLTSVALGESPNFLQQAVQSYGKKDVVGFYQNIKKSLETNSGNPVAKEATMRVYRQGLLALGRVNKAIDWKLPKEITKLNFHHRRTFIVHSQRTDFRIRLQFNMTQPGFISKVVLINEQGDRVLDSDSPNSSVEQGVEPETAWYDIGLKEPRNEPMPAGLYNFQLTDRQNGVHTGWFILDHHVPDQTPEFVTPFVGQVFSTDRPNLSWKNYVSNNYQGNQARVVRARVYKVDDQGNWDQAADKFDQRPASATSWTPKSLEMNHKYRFILLYAEEKAFGPMVIVSESSSATGFLLKD